MDNHTHTTGPIEPHRRHDAPFENVRPWDRHQLNTRPMSGHHKSGPENAAGQYRDYSRQETLISPSAVLKEEQSDSDVSDTPIHPQEREKFRFRTESVVLLSQLPPRPSIDSVDAYQAHLDDLEKAENINFKLKNDLYAKRKRKDDRMVERRAVEDQKIEALKEARRRHDARVHARRSREDDTIERAFRDLDEAESNTRNRMKRLKRGFPLDDLPESERGISAQSSSSPILTSHSSGPPAKRHQPGPPGPPGPVDHGYGAHHSRPPMNGIPPIVPSSNGPPSYQFYQNPSQQLVQSGYHYHNHYGNNYGGQPPTAQQGPPAASPIVGSNSSGPTPALPVRNPHLQREASSPTMNGHVSSTAGTPLQQPPQINTTSPNNAGNRPSGKEYNTRPPDPRPTSTTGFASINMPHVQPTSGFAAINPRGPGPNNPYSAHMTPVAKTPTEQMKVMDSDQIKGSSRDHASEVINLNTPVSSGGKRTPSTTHPYSQSEAFANRHHHCEKQDSLNRGIWTSYGPGGTKENPTGLQVEMYLRCNHEGCMRIDWRTVHGLQCHIVKSHEQPKGTIGSLEKALDRYGVAVSEVESFEKEHGVGTGGTMADPKNQKIKNKTREMQQRTSVGSATTPTDADSARKPYPYPGLSTSPPPRPLQQIPSVPSPKPVGIGFRPGAMPLGSPMFPHQSRKSHEGISSRGRSSATSDDRDYDYGVSKEEQRPQVTQNKPGVAKTGWGRVEATPPVRDYMDLDKQVRRRDDEQMFDAPPPAAKPVEAKTVVTEAKESETIAPVLPSAILASNEPESKSASAAAATPETATTTSVTMESAAQQMTAEAEKSEKKSELTESKVSTPVVPETKVPDQQEETVEKEEKISNGDHEGKEVVEQGENEKENGLDQEEHKDEEMTEEPAPTAPSSPPLQPVTVAVTSPKSTRKSTSRRTSAGMNKMDMDTVEAGGSDDDASRGDDGGRDDGPDGDTITSRLKGFGGDKGMWERSTRSKRNASGRFVGGRGRGRGSR